MERTMKLVETVLLYAPKGSTKVNRMKPAFLRTGVRVKMVSTEQFSMTIGEFLGLSEEEIKQISDEIRQTDSEAGHNVLNHPEELEQLKYLNEEVFVLWNMSSAKIDTLLNQLKKAGVPRIALKAVVTPNNITWTFAQLIRELQKEHEAYRD